LASQLAWLSRSRRRRSQNLDLFGTIWLRPNASYLYPSVVRSAHYQLQTESRSRSGNYAAFHQLYFQFFTTTILTTTVEVVKSTANRSNFALNVHVVVASTKIRGAIRIAGDFSIRHERAHLVMQHQYLINCKLVSTFMECKTSAVL